MGEGGAAPRERVPSERNRSLGAVVHKPRGPSLALLTDRPPGPDAKVSARRATVTGRRAHHGEAGVDLDVDGTGVLVAADVHVVARE